MTEVKTFIVNKHHTRFKAATTIPATTTTCTQHLTVVVRRYLCKLLRLRGVTGIRLAYVRASSDKVTSPRRIYLSAATKRTSVGRSADTGDKRVFAQVLGDLKTISTCPPLSLLTTGGNVWVKNLLSIFESCPL